MFEIETTPGACGEALYAGLIKQSAALLDGETDPVANAANLAALVFHVLPDLNWAGFYFLHGGELVVGPFQGKPACVRIPMGRGVCGTAAAERRTIIVDDVDAFPGHIPCDSDSRSELVVPLIAADRRLIGVLDLDSPRPGRFTDIDADGMGRVARIYTESLPPAGTARTGVPSG